MKKILCLACIVLFVTAAHAQTICKQQGNSILFYNNLNSAISDAVNGDTIYLPGGSFDLSTTINKSIHVIGAGSFIDSSIATGITILNGPPISIVGGADGGSIEGMLINNSAFSQKSIIFGDSIPITNFTISRCNVTSGISFQVPCSLFSIRQNIIGYTCSYYSGVIDTYSCISLSGSISNSSIVNNHILAKISGANYDYFSNNIFHYPFPIFVYYIYYLGDYLAGHDCILENNIYSTNIPGGCTNCTSNNNIFGDFVNTFINPGVPINYGNPYDPQNTRYPFDIHNNYHLKASSQGVNAGTDGTDIGIYGGSFPWKEGMIPFNPHIQTKNISGVTDSSGNLHINIKVEAQDH